MSSKSDTSMGGLLGYRWDDTNVDFSGVGFSADSGEIKNKITGAGNGTGLVYTASGHWNVPASGITVNGLTASGFGASFGLLVNKAYVNKKALYLELTAANSLTVSSGLSMPDTCTNYDEIAAFTGKDNDSVLTNGGAVISMPTTDSALVDSSARNTYVNKVTTKIGVVNSKSRYYYNLSSIRENPSTDAQKLMIWSVRRYAASNIQKYFTESYSGNKITGTAYDMRGYSYYPVDVENVTISGNAAFTFDYNTIHNSETASAANKDPGAATQHYLMQSGLLKNVTGTLTTSGNIHFKGNVFSNNNYSGVLVNKSATGSISMSESKEIVLEGITLSSASNGYLLIHKIENADSARHTVTISGIRLGGSKGFDNSVNESEQKYAKDAQVAKSLIGDVSGQNITLKFSRIKLDGRNGKSDSTYTDFASIYGTSKSIFSSATLLNSIVEADTVTGTYNYKLDEDWSAGTHKGNVTYGKEIIDTVDHRDDASPSNSKQTVYIDQDSTSGPFTNPLSGSATAKYGDFGGTNAHFLPYVARFSEANQGELNVNIHVPNVVSGCGTYNHPYNISTTAEMNSVASIIRGDTPSDGMKVRLPSDKSVTWCEEKTSCAEYEFSNGSFTYNESTWSLADVQEYMAGAYYLITDDITLTNFGGLGKFDDAGSGTNAFRGVIVGKQKEDGEYPTITLTATQTITVGGTNKIISGLIRISSGSVVKNLNISVNFPDIAYKLDTLKPYAMDNDDMPNYGAVMNKIVGGDNVIDNVDVTFNNDLVIEKDNYNSTIGGYCGVVLSGGLVFRNMTATAEDTVTEIFDGLTVRTSSGTTNFTADNQLKYIYINPYVGRVVNGYAIYETDQYGFSENGTYSDTTNYRSSLTRTEETNTLKNTGKNYSIPDINAETYNKIGFSDYATGSGSQEKINIQDGQSLFILSLITQSGSGCAASVGGAYTNSISFNGTDQKYGTQSGFKATHKALYNEVGSDTVAKTGDYAVAQYDDHTSNNQVPYLIYKYTDDTGVDGDNRASGGTYPARTLTQKTFFINLSNTTTNYVYYLPDSFRGIGFIGSELNQDNMKIYGMNGNGNTIDVNSLLYAHLIKDDSDAYNTTTNYSKATGKHCPGLALFNTINQDNGSNSRAYKSDDKYKIGNFTLKGHMSAQCLNNTGERITNPANSSGGDNKGTTIFRTGGVIGNASLNEKKYYNFYSIAMNDLHLDSIEFCGGLMPFILGGMVYINDVSADNLSIEGSGRLGGYIACEDGDGNSGIIINTRQENPDTPTVIKVKIKQNAGTDNNKKFTAGVIGGAWIKTTPEDEKSLYGYYGNLIIRNIIVEDSIIGSSDTAYQVEQTGGILAVGDDNMDYGCLIKDCTVRNTNIYGKETGGIVGYTYNNGYTKVVNCTVESTRSNNEIVGKSYAGGIYGKYSANGNMNRLPYLDNIAYKNAADSCKVSGYTINGTSGSGGIMGYASKTKSINIVNSEVTGCTFEKAKSGGIIGIAAETAYGYNLLVKNNTFKDSSYGCFIGDCNSKAADLVGISRIGNTLVVNNTTTQQSGLKDVGGTAADSSCIIYADRLDCNNGNNGTEINTIFSESTNVEAGYRSSASEYYPYITVSPKVMFGSSKDAPFMTGDGVLIKNDAFAANSVISEYTGNSDAMPAYFRCNESDVTTVKDFFTADNDVRLLDFTTEMTGTNTGYTGANFPVLTLGGGKENNNYTDEITAYIRLLTNSKFDFNEDTNQYKIVITPIECVDGNFRKAAGNAGLKLTNKVFSIDRNNTDNTAENSRLSLIDIQFRDIYAKANNTDIFAYHLYIPVRTKKLIDFKFDSGVLQDTSYKATDYIDQRRLPCNFDSWFTIYASYTYNKDDINVLLNDGRGLLWNSDKAITLTYENLMRHLPDSSQFVLVDNNIDSDNAYYADKSKFTTTINQNSHTDTIAFNQFDNFHVQTLNVAAGDLIQYTSSASGKYVECDEDDANSLAFAYDQSGNNKKYFKLKTSETSGFYSLNCTADVVESYYICIYNYKEDNKYETNGTASDAYKITVACPYNLTGGKTAFKRAEQKTSTILLGNLFKQTLTLSNLNPIDVISSSNETLTLNLTAKTEFLPGTSVQYLQGELTGQKLYRGYQVYLKRYEGNNKISSDQKIYGTPTLTYRVGSTSYSPQAIQDNATYIPIVPEDYITIGSEVGWSHEEAISLTIEYNSNENILLEFPSRSGSDDTSGISFAATSRLSYQSSGVLSSSIMKPEEDATHRYYTNSPKKATLMLKAEDQTDKDQYDPFGWQSNNRSSLGVNAKYIEQGKKGTDIHMIDAVSNFDISVLNKEAESGQKLRYTVTLQQKKGTADSPEYNIVSIDSYFDSFTLWNKNGSEIAMDSEGSYVYTIPLTGNADNWTVLYKDKQFVTRLSFGVKTKNIYYSNYKLLLKAELLDEDNNVITGYSAEGYLVYTNAKVNAHFVEKAE